MSLDANLNEIRIALGKHARHARLFYNPVGQGWVGKVLSNDGGFVRLSHARPVTFGLAPGSGDLAGWTSVVVTPDMVGQTVAVFTAGEVKNPARRWKFEPGQENWLAEVAKAGGFSGVLETEADALRLVRAPADALTRVGVLV